MLYVLKSACQWRMLPKYFPCYKTVYSYFRQWGATPFADRPSLLESLLQGLVAVERKERATFLIADAQSVKNADTAGEKGYDAGK
jgi:transposase